jgi:transcriptional regulator GlxA family with amidase domain
MNVHVILFNRFETLDAFGPVEVIGRLKKHYEIDFYSEQGGIVMSAQNVRVETKPLREIQPGGILLVPGGQGTRTEVDNEKLIQALKKISESAEYVLTVCTGAALLARTGLLKGKNATTNKIAFAWVMEQDKDVRWMRKARWVRDGKYYTSSGISAGIDMALGFIADMHGEEEAQRASKEIEYIWNRDKENDPFAGTDD